MMSSLLSPSVEGKDSIEVHAVVSLPSSCLVLSPITTFGVDRAVGGSLLFAGDPSLNVNLSPFFPLFSYTDYIQVLVNIAHVHVTGEHTRTHSNTHTF